MDITETCRRRREGLPVTGSGAQAVMDADPDTAAYVVVREAERIAGRRITGAEIRQVALGAMEAALAVPRALDKIGQQREAEERRAKGETGLAVSLEEIADLTVSVGVEG